NNEPLIFKHTRGQRSITMPSISRSKSPPKVRVDTSPKRSELNIERLKLARDEAERAMKEHKIFTIIGPYPALREALRNRGWLEKFNRNSSLPSLRGSRRSEKKSGKSDDDEKDTDDYDDMGDDDLDEHQLEDDEEKPWDENDGYYGLLSRLVKNAAPNFIWSVRATYDTNTLNKDQMVNHYSRNGCFTTKIGLCSSLKNLPWFHSSSADEFYPRCYKLSHEDDKVGFVDDYRLTACISFLKLIQNRCKGVAEPDMRSILAMSSDDHGTTTLTEDSCQTVDLTVDEQQSSTSQIKLMTEQAATIISTSGSQSLPLSKVIKATKITKVPASAIEFAITKVLELALFRDHEDIDKNINNQNDTTDEQWNQFIEYFYAASHSNVDVECMEINLSKIDDCLSKIKDYWPQYQIDGTRNIWIVKPGAKSRGRGIVVYDRLEDMLKLCSSSLSKDGKFVVQKYIERPLLIHNTKFDIRQWFLVTDWNPLTIWMFKDCYLRFCTEHFSLETRNQNVHLCNYSIQKHYKNNPIRHNNLPDENMWTNKEFIEKYLKPNRLTNKWETQIYPQMKEAIVCSMLVAQDAIDARKNSFELYGADFMLDESLKPWLIEINCSPTMARCTAVTTDMCDSVLEDTCKVMIDRKYNKSADTGRFELIHKGIPVPVPTYIGIDLRVEGKLCKTGRTSSTAHPATTTSTIVPSSSSVNTLTHQRSTLQSQSPINFDTLATRSQQITSVYSPNNSNTESRVTLKLRREMTQPTLARVELLSNSPLETLAFSQSADDNYHQYNQINGKNFAKLFRTQQNDPLHSIQPAKLKTNPSRMFIDSLPVRQLSRTKVNDRLPSPKDLITSFDLNHLPPLPLRTASTKLLKQKLLIRKGKSFQRQTVVFTQQLLLMREQTAQQ
ncbi:unnamed protein product, partial [Didymodactylos carnosus]